MADLGTLVRERMDRAGTPAYSLHDLDRRRTRRRRTQRLAAGVVGVVAFVVFASIVVAAIGMDVERRPATHRPSMPPSTAPVSPAPAGEALPEGLYQPLAPGRHYVVSARAHVWFDVPPGWVGWGLGIVDPERTGEWPDGTGFGIWQIRRVYDHPCRWNQGSTPTDTESIEDLVELLQHQPMRAATAPQDVELGGFGGKVLRLHVPTGIDFGDCAGSMFQSWPGRYHQGPGQIDQLWVLDVDGERLVIDAWWFPATPSADRAQLFEIIDSIEIEPIAS